MGHLLPSTLAMLEQWLRPSPKEQCLISGRKVSQYSQPWDWTKDSCPCGNHRMPLFSPPLSPFCPGANWAALGAPKSFLALLLHHPATSGMLETENQWDGSFSTPWGPGYHAFIQTLTWRSGELSGTLMLLPTQSTQALAGHRPFPPPLYFHTAQGRGLHCWVILVVWDLSMLISIGPQLIYTPTNGG